MTDLVGGAFVRVAFISAYLISIPPSFRGLFGPVDLYHNHCSSSDAYISEYKIKRAQQLLGKICALIKLNGYYFFSSPLCEEEGGGPGGGGQEFATTAFLRTIIDV